MHALLLSFSLLLAAKLEIAEESLEVKVPKLIDAPDVAIKDALEVIKKPASDAQLNEAARTCALLGVDAFQTISAAKSGAADTLDARLLAVADVYLGFGDWVNAERVLRTTKASARVNERLGHAQRAQKRFADAAKSYVAAINGTTGPELDEIIARIVPAANGWVLDFEAGHDSVLRNVAKSVLTAMLSHQAGEASEKTKEMLTRLDSRTPRGSLTAARVQEATAVQISALRTCYARALVKEPDLKGRMELKFTVEAGGKISGLTTPTNTTGSKPLAACIEARIKTLHFATDSAVEVTYPFVLTPI